MVFSSETFPCACGGCSCGGCLSSYGQDEAAVGAGAVTAAVSASPSQSSAARSITLGVFTGVLIWFVTRSLDRHVFGR